MNRQALNPSTVPLGNNTLSELPVSVSRPAYDRRKLTPGIIHIGLGNFHRAHQAWYLHRLMQLGEAQDWAIIGAGVRPYDETQRLKLAGQDYLTTLVELDPSGTTAEVTGSMIDYVPVETGNRALIARMSQPDIRIVSLTVTEGGYFLDPATKGFDVNHPNIQHDVERPDAPITAFGAMIAALKARRSSEVSPFTCLSCDNLQGNGTILKQTLVSLARLIDCELAEWIGDQCSFPNSMVDCIVPATGPQELNLVHSLGIEDKAPVTHERFRQWVIEDDFCAGRPDFDKVGATLSENVHDYEAMKIRVLNAGHQIVANPGELLSIGTISDCMGNRKIRNLFKRIAIEEIIPQLKPVPEMAPDAYVDLIERRFSNPRIVDTTRRVAFDGSSRHPGFVIPTLRERLGAGASVDGLALAEAIWARMCEGTREDGSEIAPNDPAWDALKTVARAAKSDPAVWLEQRQYYGDLADHTGFKVMFTAWLNMIWENGVVFAIDVYLER